MVLVSYHDKHMGNGSQPLACVPPLAHASSQARTPLPSSGTTCTRVPSSGAQFMKMWLAGVPSIMDGRLMYRGCSSSTA
jgi:hypothetical protein